MNKGREYHRRLQKIKPKPRRMREGFSPTLGETLHELGGTLYKKDHRGVLRRFAVKKEAK